jgi:hypothetical protein
VWNCIECTRISSKTAKPTAAQVRSEVWMALIHGSQGIIYFVHEWEPKFNESALLDDPEMLAAVTSLNREITRLAPILNSPTLADAVTATTTGASGGVATLVKRVGDDATYLFAVEMRGQPARARFKFTSPLRSQAKVELVGEDRSILADPTGFEDDFAPWQPRIYLLRQPAG